MGYQAALVLLFVLLFLEGGGGWEGVHYFESLGDKDGRYISASYMNDWVDKQSKSQQPT